MSAPLSTGCLRDHSSRIIAAGVILALLYLGRSVLIPLALAIMLSLLVAPLIRVLRRLRIGRASSVLVAVAALTLSFVGIAAALGAQILHIAKSLPRGSSTCVVHSIHIEEGSRRCAGFACPARPQYPRMTGSVPQPQPTLKRLCRSAVVAAPELAVPPTSSARSRARAVSARTAQDTAAQG